uniref:Amidohydrolase n=1 Tax=Pseudothermotoga hypogea TaxID=57487 RepID=A0A832IER2_9THEM
MKRNQRGSCRLLLKDFHPFPQLVTEGHVSIEPTFPVIDAHNHLTMGGYNFGKMKRTKPRIDWDHNLLLSVMDAAKVEKIVDLTPFYGEKLKAVLDFHRPHSDRIVVFGTVDFERVDSPKFPSEVRKAIVQGFKHGMRGLKIFKELGLHYRDKNGKLVMPNDRRLKPVWDTCAELKIPVLIHVADPVAFFQPLDNTNERFEELCAHPEWHFYGKGLPTFHELIQAGEELIAENPQTTFIMAHVGWYSENLRWVSGVLDKYSNAYIDISARIAELGRQPYTAKKFFERYQDRIVFGTDVLPNVEFYRIYYRFLETEDEYFPYAPTPWENSQGRWRIYGLGLDKVILRKVYRDNILNLIDFNW